MIKRILAVSLVLLLCLPLLAAAVFADTQYHFTTSAENDFIYTLPASDAPPPGLYRLDGVIFASDEDVSFSVEFDLFYEYEDENTYVSFCPISVVYKGQVGEVVAVLATQYDDFLFILTDESELLYSGDFTLTQLSVKPPLHILLETIGTFLRYTTSLFGFVVDSLLAPDGAFAPLWPLIGMGVGFALVPAGVALVNRFRP